jgi:tripartite-type tricarboxylate transporter receptor subunit TctC
MKPDFHWLKMRIPSHQASRMKAQEQQSVGRPPEHHIQGENIVTRFTIARASLFLMAATLASGSVLAQKPTGLPGNYPAKPIHLIVGTAPGGGLDNVGRPVAVKLGERWGTTVIVENRASGVGSVIAMEQTAKAAPDGYTLMIGSSSTFLNAALVLKVPYDVTKAFEPVALLTTSPFIMSVQNSSPARDVKEFLAYAKSKNGAVTYATSGTGSSGHLAGELMQYLGKVKMVQVPYKGIGPGLVDLVGGRIDMAFATPTGTLPLWKAGKMRAIAVTTPKRSKSLPDLPAIAETLPGFEISTWFGILAPAKTPKPIVDALNKEINVVIELPEVNKIIAVAGSTVDPSTPEEFRELFTGGLSRLDKLIKETGIKLTD